MITAKEAREKYLAEKFKNVDAEEQYIDICDSIQKIASNGGGYCTYHTEIHPQTRKKLEDLGYEIRSGGLNSSSKWHDIIYW